ncbi:VQ protein [Dillenia turbinata]|uniref:VQ protein n=1 Tax=Dillenia turbinata TaxID=194707 RepID=A0AAN8WAS3_9MAGN
MHAMTSSENLASIEPWTFRPTFADSSWVFDTFTRDTETLTEAFQKSLSSHNSDTLTDSVVSQLANNLTAKPEPTQASSGSGSDLESGHKRRGPMIPVNGGKVTKRKSRATKGSTTTFITADPANFRQMVQQVTGVRFGSGHVPVAPVLKPEPQRLGNRLQGCLPTLDTSAFLLDRQVVVPTTPAHTTNNTLSGGSPICFTSPAVAVDVGSGGGTGGSEFGSFAVFPTLESWKVV